MALQVQAADARPAQGDLRRVVDLMRAVELHHRVALHADEQVTGNGIHPGGLLQIEHAVDQREGALERVGRAARQDRRCDLRHTATPPLHRTHPGNRTAEHRPVAAARLDDERVAIEVEITALRSSHPAKGRVAGELVVRILAELLGGIHQLARDLGSGERDARREQQCRGEQKPCFHAGSFTRRPP